MNIVGIIQARMGSSRLPGKVLKDLSGAMVLERVVRRVQRAGTLDEVVVATTDKCGDAPIVALCGERQWPCYMGSEERCAGSITMVPRKPFMQM